MPYRILDTIRTKEDFLHIPDDQLGELASELRARMVEVTLKNGGHLASSLGSVELIIAMERVFAYDSDRLVFDVGHQAYAHKLITGRNAEFDTLRQENGISGFPKRSESPYDAFDTGHASTSVSAALGMARAMKLNGSKGRAIALIGDGALTGGLAWEALNDAGSSKLPLIIVLNDNGMSISRSVGAVSPLLMDMRTSHGYLKMKHSIANALTDNGKAGKWLSKHMSRLRDRIKKFLLPNLLFEDFGFTYLGPIDGHNMNEVIRVLKRARATDSPVIVHAITQKGYGYEPAMKDPEKFHGVSPENSASTAQSYSEVFGSALTDLAQKDNKIVAVTAAMQQGTGLSNFAKIFPHKFFDVGIAEEHAVTMAAGMACEGLRPVVAIYSTFLQRAYDQILHDVSLQKLPVVFAVDRAGLVGADGETHQGIYDVAFLSQMPGLVQYAPSCAEELRQMLALALSRTEPASVRYPRGAADTRLPSSPVVFGRWEEILPIAKVNLITYGSLVGDAVQFAEDCGFGLINARFPGILDVALMERLKHTASAVLVAEDGIQFLGSRVKENLDNVRVETVSVTNEPVREGTVLQQRIRYGLDKDSLKSRLLALEEEV